MLDQTSAAIAQLHKLRADVATELSTTRAGTEAAIARSQRLLARIDQEDAAAASARMRL